MAQNKNHKPPRDTLVRDAMPEEAIPDPVVPMAARRAPLQQRVASAILEAAARLIAAGGGDATMNDIALAAGVARATVYRYFPSRQAMLDELAELAVRDAGRRLAAARVDALETRVAVERAIRALVEVGDAIVVVAREGVRPDAQLFEDYVEAPLRRLFERGQKLGQIRADIAPEWLTDALIGVVVGVLSSSRPLGRDDAVAMTASVFLDGARVRPRVVGTD